MLVLRLPCQPLFAFVLSPLKTFPRILVTAIMTTLSMCSTQGIRNQPVCVLIRQVLFTYRYPNHQANPYPNSVPLFFL